MSPYVPVSVNASDLPQGVFATGYSVYPLYTIDDSDRCVVYPLVTPDHRADPVVGLAICIASNAFIWGTLLFYWFHRRHSYLAKRAPFSLLFMSSVGGSIMSMVALQMAILPKQWPCLCDLLYFFVMPCWIAPMAIRFAAAVNRTRFYNQAVDATLIELDAVMERHKLDDYVSHLRFVLRALCSKKELSPLEKSLFRAIVIGQAVSYLVVLPFIVMIAVLIIVNPIYRMNCYGCFQNPYGLLFLVCTIIVVICVGLVMIVYRKATDPLGELLEVKICFLLAGLFATPGQILYSSPLSERFYPESFNFQYLTLIGYLVTHFVMVVVPVSRTMHRLNTDTAGFMDVLNDPAHRSEFGEFLKSELAYENIKFMDEIRHFKINYPFDAPAVRVAKALRLVNSMVIDGSLLQVNLPDKIRTELENFIQPGVADINIDIFNKAEDEIRRLLEVDAWRRFKKLIKKKQADSAFAVLSTDGAFVVLARRASKQGRSSMKSDIDSGNGSCTVGSDSIPFSFRSDV